MVKDFFWKKFIEPYFLFGYRWILLLPFLLITAYFLFIKKYKELSFRNTINSKLFWVPSLGLLVLCVALYVTHLYFPLPKDRFVIAIADFQPVSTEEEAEAKKLKDRLIREIEGRQKQYNTRVSIIPLDVMINCSTEEGTEIARNLGRENRAHVVICGNVMTDHQEFFFDVVIVNLLTDIRADMRRFNMNPPKTSPLPTFKKIAISKVTDFISFMFGFAKYESKQYEEAISIFKSIKDQQAASLFYLGISSDLLNKTTQAIYYYDQAIKLQPDLVEAWSNKGLLLMDLNRPTEALLAEDEAINLRHNYAEAWFNKGYILIDMKKFDEALTATNRGLDLQPDFVGGLVNKAVILEKLRRYPEALEVVDKAIGLKSDMFQAWDMKGVVLIRLDKLDDALISLKKASILKPDRAESYYNLACVYALKGNKKNAIGNLETAVKLDGRLREEMKKDKDLKNLWHDETFKKLLE